MSQLLELGISVRSKNPGVSEGDIVTARKPLGYVGKKEQANLLWLVVETNLEINDWVVQNETFNNKFETYIVLEDLNSNGFEFDLDKVRDVNLNYQPGLDPDATNGIFKKTPTPLNIDHLLKTKG